MTTGGLIDRWDHFAERHKKAISFVTGIWFALTCASYAGFIDLPQVEFLTGMPAIMAAAISNAAWWGWLRPRIERRRLDRSGTPAGREDIPA